MTSGRSSMSQPSDGRVRVKVWMRRCLTCATFDRSSRYDGLRDAAADRLWQRDWRCRLCRESRFDLVPERLRTARRKTADLP